MEYLEIVFCREDTQTMQVSSLCLGKLENCCLLLYLPTM